MLALREIVSEDFGVSASDGHLNSLGHPRENILACRLRFPINVQLLVVRMDCVKERVTAACVVNEGPDCARLGQLRVPQRHQNNH